MDGQVLQLTQLLYLVAEEVDGKRNFQEIAERVTEKFGRAVSADNIRFLVEEKMRPIGVLAAADGSSPKLEKADPMLALNFRTGLVPERAVRVITTIFYPLFFMPVMIAVVGGLVALDVWLFFVHGVAQSVRDIAYDPVLFLLVFGLVVLSAAFHECGHATACRYGGATPGQMGAGIYLVYPAFFSDVTDVYRLGKLGRVRTDLGGIYFNMIFSLVTAGAYFLTGFEPLLVIIVIQHFEMIHQLLPFLRLDGYYIVSDITGVPDLFSRIRPILSSLVPGREPGPAVTALKPWARAVVTAWVLTMVPVLLYLLVLAGMTMPRLFATAYDSFFVQWDEVSSAYAKGEGFRVASGSIQIVSLTLPLMGLTYTLGRAGKNLGTAAWTRTQDRPALRTTLVVSAAAAAGLLVFLWWPNGDYKPIQPGERGTIQGSLSAVRDIPGGRPGLTPEREQELIEAPGSGTSGSGTSGSGTSGSGTSGSGTSGSDKPGSGASDSETPGSGTSGSGTSSSGTSGAEGSQSAQPGAGGEDGQMQEAQQSGGQPSGQEVSTPDDQQEVSVPQEEVSVPQEEVSIPAAESTTP